MFARLWELWTTPLGVLSLWDVVCAWVGACVLIGGSVFLLCLVAVLLGAAWETGRQQ